MKDSRTRKVGKNMSFSKTKMFLAGALWLAMTLIVVDTAPAWDGRLWKPYQPEQFGGQRRSPDGVYGAVEMLWWKLDAPRNVSPYMAVTELPSDFQLGTRITLGNRRGHHGWRFTGYGLSGLGGSITEESGGTGNWLTDIGFVPPGGLPPLPPPAFLNWYTHYETNSFLEAGRNEYGYQTRIVDLDLAYTYRPHPFKWGELDFFAGVKYRDINDKLLYLQSDNTYSYTYMFTPLPWTTPAPASPPDGIIGSTFATTTRSTEKEVTNRIVGPSLGFDLTRRNLRWTFGAGASVFLGINNQSFRFNQVTVQGVLADSAASFANLTISDLITYRAITPPIVWPNLVPTPNQLHKQHRTVFSPGVSLQLSAKWHWTDAVGIKVGFDSTIMDNIARGSTLVETPLPPLPGLPAFAYALRDRGDTVILFGFNIGLEVRR